MKTRIIVKNRRYIPQYFKPERPPSSGCWLEYSCLGDPLRNTVFFTKNEAILFLEDQYKESSEGKVVWEKEFK